MKAWTALLAFGFAGACGGGGSELEGIYSLDTWNENTTVCTDPGPSVLSLHPKTAFYLKRESLFGHSFLNMVGCETVEQCRMQANDDDLDLDVDFLFYENGNDHDGYTQRDVSGFDDVQEPNMCQGTITSATLNADDTGVAVRIQRIHTFLYPKPDSGDCDDGVLAAAAGLPCDQLETIHGTFMEDL